MNQLLRRALLSTAALSAFALPQISGALAADAPTPQVTNSTETIVVTARRRSEALKDVPAQVDVGVCYCSHRRNRPDLRGNVYF